MPEPHDLRRRVERLTADSIGWIDQEDLEHWPACFTEDGVYRIMARENDARGLPAALLSCHGQVCCTTGCLPCGAPTSTSPTTAGTWCLAPAWCARSPRGGGFFTNFQVLRTMQTGERAVFAVGIFDDLIDASAAPLLFKEKTVVCDSSRLDTRLVIPL